MAQIAFEIDPVHTSIAFGVRHMMVSNVRGAFTKFSGTIHYDTDNPANSVVEVVIDATSIDTNEPKRDAHLKSPDFLDVANHPEIRFRSKRIEIEGGSTEVEEALMTGDLTIRGVTKEVKLKMEAAEKPIIDPQGKQRIGGSATTKVNRREFGLAYNALLEAGGMVVADEVRIHIEVEATHG